MNCNFGRSFRRGLLVSFPLLFTFIIATDALAMSVTRIRARGIDPTPENIRGGKKFTFKITGEESANTKFFVDSIFELNNAFDDWDIVINVEDGNRRVEFFAVGDRENTRFISKSSSPKSFSVADGKYRLRYAKGNGQLQKLEEENRIIFKAQSVPEPFSTTAAVGLAIAGVARILKKKRTEDA